MSFLPRETYEHFIYTLPETYAEIRTCTLRLYPNSATTCFVRGSIWFHNGLELRVFEYLDLADGILLNYSYTVWWGRERIRWYDPQPHPENPDLAPTFPHHRHDPPDIKHHRCPAPGITFTSPNLPTLIADCIALGALLNNQTQ